MGVTETVTNTAENVANGVQDAANTVANGFTNAVNVYWHNPVLENGVYNLSPAGVLVLGAHVLVTLIYLLWLWGRKTWKRWCVPGGCFAGVPGRIRAA